MFIELKVTPMSNKLNSKAAESILRNTAVLGQCLGEVPVSKEDIAYLIQEEHPTRYENALNGMARDGYEGLCSKQVVTDYMLGIDCVLSVDGELIGVDVTVNPDEVDWKYRKLQQLKDSLQFCGIDRTIVLFLYSEEDMVTNEQLYLLLFSLLDTIDVLCDKDRWVDIIEHVM